MKPVDKLSLQRGRGRAGIHSRRLRAENCDVDSLTAMTRRAAELLDACRKRLTATDAELQTILQQLEP